MIEVCVPKLEALLNDVVRVQAYLYLEFTRLGGVAQLGVVKLQVIFIQSERDECAFSPP